MKVESITASRCLAVILLAASGIAMPAFDADPLEDLSMSNPEFMKGRAAIEAQDWDGAVKSLTAADKRTPNNADINNLLGFAYRSAGQLDPAINHYQRALKIDPRHRGAHEYIGEAYLRAGNPSKAEEHLAALKRVCPIVCQERDDLGRKIAAYKGAR